MSDITDQQTIANLEARLAACEQERRMAMVAMQAALSSAVFDEARATKAEEERDEWKAKYKAATQIRRADIAEKG